MFRRIIEGQGGTAQIRDSIPIHQVDRKPEVQLQLLIGIGYVRRATKAAIGQDSHLLSLRKCTSGLDRRPESRQSTGFLTKTLLNGMKRPKRKLYNSDNLVFIKL